MQESTARDSIYLKFLELFILQVTYTPLLQIVSAVWAGISEVFE